jgi:hypothetical protein
MLVDEHLCEPGAQRIRTDDLDTDAVGIDEGISRFCGKRLGNGLILAVTAPRFRYRGRPTVQARATGTVSTPWSR